jgi:hypothetical protein
MPEMYIRPSTENICSCNCCDNRNYKSRLIDCGKVVPVIFDVKLGTAVCHLCPECLHKMLNMTQEAIEKAGL